MEQAIRLKTVTGRSRNASPTQWNGLARKMERLPVRIERFDPQIARPAWQANAVDRHGKKIRIYLILHVFINLICNGLRGMNVAV